MSVSQSAPRALAQALDCEGTHSRSQRHALSPPRAQFERDLPSPGPSPTAARGSNQPLDGPPHQARPSITSVGARSSSSRRPLASTPMPRRSSSGGSVPRPRTPSPPDLASPIRDLRSRPDLVHDLSDVAGREALRRDRAADLLPSATTQHGGQSPRRSPPPSQPFGRSVSFEKLTLQEGTPPMETASFAYKRRQQSDGSSPRARARISTRDTANPGYRKTDAEQKGQANQDLGDQEEDIRGCWGRFVNDLLPGLVGAGVVGCGCMWQWEVISPVVHHQCVYTLACWAPWPEGVEVGLGAAGELAHAGMAAVEATAAAFFADEDNYRCTFGTDAFGSGGQWEDAPRACAAAWKRRHDLFYEELKEARATPGVEFFDRMLLCPLLLPLLALARLAMLFLNDFWVPLPKCLYSMVSCKCSRGGCCGARAQHDTEVDTKQGIDAKKQPEPTRSPERQLPEPEPEPDPAAGQWDGGRPSDEAGTVEVVFDTTAGPPGIVLEVKPDGQTVLDEVKPGAPGAAAGLRRGQVLLAVGGKSVSGVDDVLTHLRTAERPLGCYSRYPPRNS